LIDCVENCDCIELDAQLDDIANKLCVEKIDWVLYKLCVVKKDDAVTLI
jgi:hypothetical protein